MTVTEFYRFLNEKIPSSLSCSWDNDGLACCPDGTREVKRVLVSLDITSTVIDKAISGGYDVILAHHPLLFHGLKALNKESGTPARRCLRLLSAGISAMSFHTRLDAVSGGVNDVLATALGLTEVVSFGEEGIGRIGTLPAPVSLTDFAAAVRDTLGAPAVTVADAGKPVFRVALLGGDGKDDCEIAKATGADTYLSGDLSYHQFVDAPEDGINLIAAGHFFTEFPVCKRLAELTREADPTITVTVANSNAIRYL